MPDCTFCGNPLRKGTGLLFVRKDGKPFYFCSSKCRKNSIGLKREGRKKRWTKSYKDFMASKGKAKEPSKKAPKEKKKPEPKVEKPKEEKKPEKKEEKK